MSGWYGELPSWSGFGQAAPSDPRFVGEGISRDALFSGEWTRWMGPRTTQRVLPPDPLAALNEAYAAVASSGVAINRFAELKAFVDDTAGFLSRGAVPHANQSVIPPLYFLEQFARTAPQVFGKPAPEIPEFERMLDEVHYLAWTVAENRSRRGVFLRKFVQTHSQSDFIWLPPTPEWPTGISWGLKPDLKQDPTSEASRDESILKVSGGIPVLQAMLRAAGAKPIPKPFPFAIVAVVGLGLGTALIVFQGLRRRRARRGVASVAAPTNGAAPRLPVFAG